MAAPGALALIVRTDLEVRLAGACRACTRLAGRLTGQGPEPAALAATPVITAVVAEGRRLAGLAAEAKAVAAAVLEHHLFATKTVLEHRLFATKTGLERRVVFAEGEPEGDADGDIVVRMARSARL